jgi:hypothetical protein
MATLEEFAGVSKEETKKSGGMTLEEFAGAPTQVPPQPATNTQPQLKTGYGDILTEAAQRTAASVASTPQFLETLINPNKSVFTDPIIPQSYREFFGLGDTGVASDVVGRTLEKIPANVVTGATVGGVVGGPVGATVGAVSAIPTSLMEAMGGEMTVGITGDEEDRWKGELGGAAASILTGGLIEGGTRAVINKAKGLKKSALESDYSALLSKDQTLRSIVESSGTTPLTRQIEDLSASLKEIDPSLETMPSMLLRQNAALEKAMKTLAADDPALIQLQREALTDTVGKIKQHIMTNANITDKNAALLALENRASEVVKQTRLNALASEKELGETYKMKQEAIDGRLVALYDDISKASDSDVMGEKITNAYNTAIKAKIDSAQELYTPVIKAGNEAGDVPVDSVKTLYQTLSGLTDDQFKGLPEPLRIAINKFKSVIREDSNIAYGFTKEVMKVNGREVPKIVPKTVKTEEFQPVSFEALHNLRKELNFSISRQENPTVKNFLTTAKKTVDEQINNFPSKQVVDDYWAVNDNYATVVGRGIRDLKTTETMNSNVWNAAALNITRNIQNAREFLTHTEKDGVDILTQAIKTRLYKNSVDDATGQIDFGKFRTQVRQMQEVLKLDELSGLRKNLVEDGVGFILKSKDEMKALEQAQINATKQKANTVFERIYGSESGGGGVDRYVDSFLSTPAVREEFFTNLDKMGGADANMVVQALRARLIDDAVNKGAKFPSYAESTPVANAYKKLFSPDEINILERSTQTLAKVKESEAIFSKLDPTINTVKKDPWLEPYGISRTSFISAVKDRIMSVTQKIAYIGSTIEKNKAAADAAVKNKAVLVDADKLYAIAKELETTGDLQNKSLDAYKQLIAKYAKDEMVKGSVGMGKIVGTRSASGAGGITLPYETEQNKQAAMTRGQALQEQTDTIQRRGLFSQ